jgi:hypothetical protein
MATGETALGDVKFGPISVQYDSHRAWELVDLFYAADETVLDDDSGRSAVVVGGADHAAPLPPPGMPGDV